MATGMAAILMFHNAGAAGLEPGSPAFAGAGSGVWLLQQPPSAHPFCQMPDDRADARRAAHWLSSVFWLCGRG